MYIGMIFMAQNGSKWLTTKLMLATLNMTFLSDPFSTLLLSHSDGKQTTNVAGFTHPTV